MARLVLAGIGNEFRSDDAAGIYTVQQIEKKSRGAAECRYFQEDILSLLPMLETGNTVIIVDAVMSGSLPGTLHRFDLSREIPDSPGIRFSGHSFSPLDAVRLAMAYIKIPEKLILFGIEGINFGHGTAMSPEVKKAADGLAGAIHAEFL